jgi:hypothetical protein
MSEAPQPPVNINFFRRKRTRKGKHHDEVKVEGEYVCPEEGCSFRTKAKFESRRYLIDNHNRLTNHGPINTKIKSKYTTVLPKIEPVKPDVGSKNQPQQVASDIQNLQQQNQQQEKVQHDEDQQQLILEEENQLEQQKILQQQQQEQEQENQHELQILKQQQQEEEQRKQGELQNQLEMHQIQLREQQQQIFLKEMQLARQKDLISDLVRERNRHIPTNAKQSRQLKDQQYQIMEKETQLKQQSLRIAELERQERQLEQQKNWIEQEKRKVKEQQTKIANMEIQLKEKESSEPQKLTPSDIDSNRFVQHTVTKHDSELSTLDISLSGIFDCLGAYKNIQGNLCINIGIPIIFDTNCWFTHEGSLLATKMTDMITCRNTKDNLNYHMFDLSYILVLEKVRNELDQLVILIDYRKLERMKSFV